MTFAELTTPINLIWPPVAYTVAISCFILLSRKLKRSKAPLQMGHILRIFIQGAVLEAAFIVAVFVDPSLLNFL
ncbi:MAG: hypothetical protein P8126_08160 [Gammaproteobacteria bacterium]